MKKACTSLLVLLLLAPVTRAGEGFSLSLGLGGGVWHLPEDSLNDSLRQVGRSDGNLLTGTLSSGLAVRLSFAYNILGWATIEAGFTGHGWNLGGADIGGSGHVAVVAHFHPLQLWWPERRWDATVFLGGGYTMLGGGHQDDNINRGLEGGLLECGLTGRFFIEDWLSVGVDLRFGIPFFETWIVDWGDIEFSLSSSPPALFTQILAVTTFHFLPVGE